MSPNSSIHPPTGGSSATNGTPRARRFALGELAGLALIVLVGLLVSATVGFDSLAAPVVLLLALGGLVLAEHKVALPGRSAHSRHAAGTGA